MKSKKHDHRPRLLTQSELESLQQDAKESNAWMRSELKRRRAAGILKDAKADRSISDEQSIQSNFE